MRQGCWPLALATVLCLCIATRTTAQPQMPELSSDVIKAPAALNTNQQKQLDTFIREWTTRLINGEDEQVAEARGKLLEPFAKGGTDLFEMTYSTALSLELAKAMTSERVVVRLNAMIVATELIDPGVVGLIIQGLSKDEKNPAVRYWAGKAMAQLAAAAAKPSSKVALPEAAQKRLLEAVSGALAKEEATVVVEQLLRAMAQLSVAEAVDSMVKVLNERINVVAKAPGGPIAVDYEGMRLVYTSLVTAQGQGKVIPPATLKALALVAYRFMTLTLVELNTGQVKITQQGEYTQMVDLGDTILRWVVTQMGGANPPTGDVKNQIYNEKWSTLLFRADEWQRFLEDKPYNFGPQDVEVLVPR